MPKVVVYIPAEDARSLEAENEDVAQWVRALVKNALKLKRDRRG